VLLENCNGDWLCSSAELESDLVCLAGCPPFPQRLKGCKIADLGCIDFLESTSDASTCLCTVALCSAHSVGSRELILPGDSPTCEWWVFLKGGLDRRLISLLHCNKLNAALNGHTERN